MRSSLACLTLTAPAIERHQHAGPCRGIHLPAAAIPAADFFANATLSGAVLSPDGRHVAVLVSAKDGRVQLYTVDLPSMKVAGLTCSKTPISAASPGSTSGASSIA